MSHSEPQILAKTCPLLPDLEALLAVYGLLSTKQEGAAALASLTDAQVKMWRQSYRHLFETYRAVEELTGAFVLEFLLAIFTEDLTLEMFERFLLDLPEEDRVWSLAPWGYLLGIDKDTIKAALTSDEVLDSLYSGVQESCSSYLGFVAFIRESDRYIREYVSLAKEIRSLGLADRLGQYRQEAEVFQEMVWDRLTNLDPLALSEELMGKSFRNRGPYEMTCFIPSLVLPSRCLRLFDNSKTKGAKQLLFYRIGDAKKDFEETVAAFKAFADETRYRILILLSQSGPMKGQEIVQALKLAPSTISHHMTALAENGLVVEEPVKTAKYYSLSKKNLDQLLKTIVEDLDLKTFEE